MTDVEKILEYLRGGSQGDLDLQRGVLSNIRLVGADLKGVNLSYASLDGADLSNADLEGAKLIGADLSHAKLKGANLKGVYLSGTKLKGCNLSKADLRYIKLKTKNLSMLMEELDTTINELDIVCTYGNGHEHFMCAGELRDKINDLHKEIDQLFNQENPSNTTYDYPDTHLPQDD